jgi:hypothetical protein
MQPYLGSVVWCLANTTWLGSKFFGAFTLLVVKVYNLSECKTNRLAMLTVKSGLDPHMITELEDGLKLCSLVILAICLWRISYLMLNVGWYKLILY